MGGKVDKLLTKVWYCQTCVVPSINLARVLIFVTSTTVCFARLSVDGNADVILTRTSRESLSLTDLADRVGSVEVSVRIWLLHFSQRF